MLGRQSLELSDRLIHVPARIDRGQHRDAARLLRWGATAAVARPGPLMSAAMMTNASTPFRMGASLYCEQRMLVPRGDGANAPSFSLPPVSMIELT